MSILACNLEIEIPANAIFHVLKAYLCYAETDGSAENMGNQCKIGSFVAALQV